MNTQRKPRAFRRDDQLSVRIPEDKKNRLKQLARMKLRDTSNLALEFICAGIENMEATHGQTQGQSGAAYQGQ